MRGDGGDRRAVTGDGTMCTEGGGLPVVCWSDLYLRCVCLLRCVLVLEHGGVLGLLEACVE